LRAVPSGYCQDESHAQGDKQAQDRHICIKPQIPEKMEVSASRPGCYNAGFFPEPETEEKREIQDKPVDGAAEEEDAEKNGEADEHELGGIGKFLPGSQPVKKCREKAHQGEKDNPAPDQHENQGIAVSGLWL
jgi:hypothetical protein